MGRRCKKSMRLNIKRAIYSFFFIFVSLASVMGVVAVTAMRTINGDEIVASINEAAKVQVVALATKKCFESLDNSKQTFGEVEKGQFVSTQNVVVGPWLENIIEDGDPDGDYDIDCFIKSVTSDAKVLIFEVFAEYVLGSKSEYMNQIIYGNCGSNSIFKPINSDGEVISNCRAGTVEKFKIDYDKIEGIFQGIYDKYVENQYSNGYLGKYLVKWKDLDKFYFMPSSDDDGFVTVGKDPLDVNLDREGQGSIYISSSDASRAVAYRVYFNDFEVACMKVGEVSDLYPSVSLDYDGGTFGKSNIKPIMRKASGEFKTIMNRNGNCGDLGITGSIPNSTIQDYRVSLVSNLMAFCREEISQTIAQRANEYEEPMKAIEGKYVGIMGAFDEWDSYNVLGNTEGAYRSWVAYYKEKTKDDQVDNQDLVDYAKYRFNEEINRNIGSWTGKYEGIFIEQSGDEYITGEGGRTYVGGYVCNSAFDVDIDVAITEPEEPGANIGVQPSCSSSGAASSLAWIVCPVLEWVGNAAEGIYEDYVEPQLQIRATLFNEGDEAAKGAWESFRAFANTIFVILLLVVVFSQVTGYGIDNYGIKKILPKLIIAAILINLSYYICVLAVDLSNIIGNGARSIFQNINISPAECLGGEVVGGVCQGVPGGAGLGSKVVTGVAVLGIVVAGIWASPLVQGGGSLLGGILIMLIMAAISVLIAVLGLFLILSIRQAAVLILTVVSPVAFVCFILPNTKKIFSKWLKFGWSLLLVYPICGLLVGGGDFASRLILSSSSNFMMVFTAMIVGIVPIFFIPTVLKNSLSAAGNIGAKISGIRRGIGKSSSRHLGDAIKKSDTFRRADNFVGRNIGLTARKRAAALKASAALAKERSERARYGNRKNMERTLAAVAAAEEAKDYDTSVNETLALMRSSGTEGGIRMENGERRSYAIDNALERVGELEKHARKNPLNAAQQTELAALSRGLAGMSGGASKLAGIVRNAGAEFDDRGRLVRRSFNANFMNAMGGVYGKDSAVSSKMNEKDQAVGVYMEHFLPGGDGAGEKTFYDARTDTKFQEAVKARNKSYKIGLSQGGAAFDEYLASIGSKEEAQRILDDAEFLNTMADEDYSKLVGDFKTRFDIEGRSASRVVIDGGGRPPAPNREYGGGYSADTSTHK